MPFVPPEFPQKLPGSFWGLTTFFNPQGYKNKIVNYRLFRESLSKQGLPLLAVELAFSGQPFELKTQDADILVQVRADGVMWQKERMMNIGLQKLPADCDKIAWLDADILFQNDGWVQDAAALLEKYIVVQPFSFVEWLPKPGSPPSALSVPRKIRGEIEKLHGMAYVITHGGKNCFKDFMLHGHSGYAWTARKALFDKHGFYDRDILGSGDLLMAYAFYGNITFGIERRLQSLELINNYRAWADGVYKDVRDSVSYVNGTTLHLWHGLSEDRYYRERDLGKKLFAFDPETDIRISDNGCWEWATDKLGLHKWTAKYFSMRNEDGNRLKILAKTLARGSKNAMNKLDLFAHNLRKALRRLFLEGNRLIGLFGLFLKKRAPALYSFLKGGN